MKIPEKHPGNTNNTIVQRSTPFFQAEESKDFFGPEPERSSAFFSANNVQTKLTIGRPDDPYEKEADAMADKIQDSKTSPEPEITGGTSNLQRKEEPSPFFNQITPLIQRQEEEEEMVQAKSNTKAGNKVNSNFEQSLQSSKGAGSPMSAGVRNDMEGHFGADFSGVSIHTDSRAESMSKSINAQAFTHGSDIYFNSGKYQPESKEGRHLLAHELTHTVQQGAVSRLNPKPESSELVQREASASEETDFEAELQESERDAEAAVDPNPANESRQQADQSLEIQDPAQANQNTAPELLPAQSSPSAAPPAPTPQQQEDQIPEEDQEQSGPVGEDLKQESVNVCDDAGKKATKLAQNEKTHDQADNKQKQAEAAVVTPADESQSKSNTEQVGELKATSPPETKEVQAKQKLDQELDKAVPKSIKEMNEFKSKGKAKVVGNKVLSEVNKDVSAVQNTYNKIEQAPAPKPPDPSAELPAIEQAPGTASLNLGKDAVPPLAPQHTDFSDFDNKSDELLQKEEITQEQLDMVDTGDLAEANKERGGLKKKVAEEPAKIQEFAQNKTQEVETDLKKEEKDQKKAMKDKRAAELGKTKDKQSKTKTDLEKKREEVAKTINGIYEQAQTSVKTKLENLEKDSLARFDREQAIASNQFETEVKSKVSRWKRKRYSGIFGGAKWLKDKLLGIDDFPEIKQIFVDAKANFVRKIDQLIADITRDNQKVIDDCKKEIEEAKIKMQEYVDSLGPDLRDIGQQSMEDMKAKLKALDGYIDKKKEELQKKLCDKKEEAIKKIDEKIEKMKEEMSGALAKLGNLLLNAAMKFFKWALEKAGKSPDQIMGIISKGKAVLKKIFTDPIGFIMNVVTGVKQGINNFSANIKKHLVGGMISWLTGAMG